jgi:hypothetical protein
MTERTGGKATTTALGNAEDRLGKTPAYLPRGFTEETTGNMRKKRAQSLSNLPYSGTQVILIWKRAEKTAA